MLPGAFIEELGTARARHVDALTASAVRDVAVKGVAQSRSRGFGDKLSMMRFDTQLQNPLPV